MKRSILTMVAIAAFAGAAEAQLIIGHDDTSGGTNAWSVNVNDGSSNALWAGFEVWGLAYDPASGTIYANDGSTLGFGQPNNTFPDGTLSITDASGAAQSMVSLAWARGGLYSTKNIANEAVWQIDVNTGVASIVFDYTDGDYDFGGLAFNNADGLFYATNDDSTPARGLYSIDVFGGGGINLVAQYPAGETDIDGLAIGGGIAYLVEDEAGETIHRYDFASGQYLTPLTSPFQSSEVFSGATYIPAPGSIALLGIAGFAARRRRR